MTFNEDGVFDTHVVWFVRVGANTSYKFRGWAEQTDSSELSPSAAVFWERGRELGPSGGAHVTRRGVLVQKRH